MKIGDFFNPDDLDLSQNLITSSFEPGSTHKISGVIGVTANTDTQTDRETNKHTQKHNLLVDVLVYS